MGICLAICAISYCISLNSALSLRMDKEPPYWVTAAMPPAISKIIFGGRQYMVYDFIHNKFAAMGMGIDAQRINAAISELATTPLPLSAKELVLSGDDKGIVVISEIAFNIFGYKVEGVLYIYYLILLISGTIFCYAYRNNPFALLLLASFFLCHRLIQPMIKYDGQLGGLTALRCIPILAFPAVMHCLLFFWEKRVTFLKILMLFIQIGIIVFTVFVRSTAMWELFVIAIIGILALIFNFGPNVNLGSKVYSARCSALLALGASILLMTLLKVHLSYGFPEEYYRGDQIVTRVIWHNIYSGFAFNPNFVQRENLHVDDFTILEATEEYMKQSGRELEWEKVIGPSTDYTTINWASYDALVREMTYEKCKSYPIDCTLTIIWYKPVSLIKNLLWVYGFQKYPPDMDVFVSLHPEIGTVVKNQFIFASDQLDLKRERGAPWVIRLALFALFFAVAGYIYPINSLIYPVLFSVGVLNIGSLAPSLVGYPAPHTIAEIALSVPLLIVCLASLIGKWCSQSLKK